MRHDVAEWMRGAREKAEEGAVDSADLDRLQEMLARPLQSILYLYSKSTNMRSGVASWAFYDATEPHEPKLPSADAPYESVLAAVRDGWRVVQFPVPTLYEYTELDNRYLGYEFILEKWM